MNNYYGIPVVVGKKLTEGAVADTCKAAGVQAVCAGDSKCQYSSKRCQVLSIEKSKVCEANASMSGLAKRVCGEGKLPIDCPELNGLFNYMHGWEGGECGVVGGQQCVHGSSYISGNPDMYYAYCVTDYKNTAPTTAGKNFSY